MKWQALAALLGLGLMLGACDGGSSGTGITTLTEGNVASVVSSAASSPAPTSMASVAARADGAAGAAASDALAGIAVSIDGTDVRDETDASGAFHLSGDYASDVIVRFTRAAGQLDASLAINVPAGGTLGLNDVTLDAASGTATPASQSVLFAGTITGIDCAAAKLVLVSQQRPEDGDSYTVDLASSSIVDQAGRTVPCSVLAPGDDATVSGAVNPDGSFGDATVVLDDGGS
jgi:hypothetical protein